MLTIGGVQVLVFYMIIALPLGCAIGWGTGTLIRKFLHATSNTPRIEWLDMLLGFCGFALGSYISYLGISLIERIGVQVIGSLLFGRIYFLLISSLGAFFLAALTSVLLIKYKVLLYS